LLFDDKRYDLAKVGRYKYNKKLGVADRIMFNVLAENVVDPRTGEILFEEGHKLSEADAFVVENAGVKVVNVLNSDGENVKVVGNNFVDLEKYISNDDIKVSGKVHFPTLVSILDNYTDEDEIVEQINLIAKKDRKKDEVNDASSNFARTQQFVALILAWWLGVAILLRHC
jgi:DNA-directed RNA polymerase subunit beta